MTGSADKVEFFSRAEVGWLVVVTVLAGLVRFIGLADDGISHFDEGVYVLWSAGAGYPFREFFAPPLFPLLVHAASAVVGSSELIAQAVSAFLGTATVPLVWWVARRWHSRVAAAATAPLVAFSGIHVAFSRMALTDVCFSFLFVLAMWLVSETIGCAFHVKLAHAGDRSRQLRLRGFLWAVAGGFAAGAAMNTKYNGLLVVVFAAGSLGLFAVIPTLRQAVQWRQGVGCITVLAATAGILYLPWFWHIHSNFGYGRLLAHHRGYVAGWASWPANLATMFLEQWAFSDFTGWVVPTLGILAAVALSGRTLLSRSVSATVVGVAAAGLVLAEAVGWLIGPILVIWLTRNPRPATILHLTWLVGLFVLTPLYQPYPRLLLPLVAAGWLAFGAVLAELVALWPVADAMPRGLLDIRWISVGAASVAATVLFTVRADNQQSVNARPPSLKIACESLRGAIANDRAVAFLVRPPVLVYVEWQPQFTLLEPAGVGAWLGARTDTVAPRFLLVDMALLRDNPAACESLQSATDRLREVTRVQYRPGLSVLMDDFGRDARLAAADSRLAETYALVLYRLEPGSVKPATDRKQVEDFDRP